MTPISHSLFGFTAGFILSPITGKFGISRKRTVLLCTLGAILPDIDSISLILKRQIYYGTNWYSHHALTHSIAGALLISFTFMLLFQPRLSIHSFKEKTALNKWFISFAVLCVGCIIHLPCDMITLPGVWNGIPIFAPFSWKRYGGWTHIPWKDFYLIYLSIITYAVFFIIYFAELIFKRKTIVLPVLSLVILFGATYHTYHSKFINYHQWNKQQKELVGERLYGFASRAEKMVFRLWHVKTIF